MYSLDKEPQRVSEDSTKQSNIGSFGMSGLYSFLQKLQQDPSIGILPLGVDLTSLGLNLNSTKRDLYQSFAGPWAEHICRPQDITEDVPEEYLTSVSIRDKLPVVSLTRLTDDVLFYLFYNYPREVHQIKAAAVLYDRGWRFFKKQQVWITRPPESEPKNITGGQEKSTFCVFDPIEWTRTTQEISLQYSDLEDKPIIDDSSREESSMQSLNQEKNE
ncbi:NOT2 / NOT3 / NOT5 family domain-containing protein [Ditylenchus destructor]|nr:NOT2 / NOT3 / NOT5 family domain-containing protein [Ditylenchus destructor]